METARHATAILLKLLFSHRGGRCERGLSPRCVVHASHAAALHTPDESDPFSYAYFGA